MLARSYAAQKTSSKIYEEEMAKRRRKQLDAALEMRKKAAAAAAGEDLVSLSSSDSVDVGNLTDDDHHTAEVDMHTTGNRSTEGSRQNSAAMRLHQRPTSTKTTRPSKRNVHSSSNSVASTNSQRSTNSIASRTSGSTRPSTTRKSSKQNAATDKMPRKKLSSATSHQSGKEARDQKTPVPAIVLQNIVTAPIAPIRASSSNIHQEDEDHSQETPKKRELPPRSASLDYETMFTVLESWETAHQHFENFEIVLGTSIARNLFTEKPQAKAVFGFPKSADPNSADFLRTKRFLMHADFLVSMLDSAFQMMGPDEELLTEMLMELGKKHAESGVEPEMFAVFRDALLQALKNILPDFSNSTRQAWKQTLDKLSFDMIRGMKSWCEFSFAILVINPPQLMCDFIQLNAWLGGKVTYERFSY